MRTDVSGADAFLAALQGSETIQSSSRVPPRFLVDEEILIVVTIIFLVHVISNPIVSDLF